MLEYVNEGNHSHLVRVVKDEEGNECLEYVNIITIQDDYMEADNGFDDEDDDLFYDSSDEILEGNNRTRFSRNAVIHNKKGRCSCVNSYLMKIYQPANCTPFLVRQHDLLRHESG